MEASMHKWVVIYDMPFYSWWMFVSVGFLAGSALCASRALGAYRKKKWPGTIGYSVFAFIWVIASCMTVHGAVLTSVQTYVAYHAGSYLTVSGRIENLKKGSDSHSTTRFSVGKARFVLQDDMAGFNQADFLDTQKSGGPKALKDGDLVTIKYVHSSYEQDRVGSKHIILYIGKFPDRVAVSEEKTGMAAEAGGIWAMLKAFGLLKIFFLLVMAVTTIVFVASCLDLIKEGRNRRKGGGKRFAGRLSDYRLECVGSVCAWIFAVSLGAALFVSA